MAKTRDSSERSHLDAERRRAELRDTAPAVAVMAASGLVFAVSDLDGTSGTVVWAVLVLGLSALVLRAEVRSLRRADEYQRTVQLEALALGFVLAMSLLWASNLVLSLGLDVDARVLLHASFTGGLVGWLVVRAVRTRRA